MRNQKIIIVDCNYLGHSCRFAIDPKMKTTTGVYTNVIFGFLRAIITIAQTFDTNRFAFVWDSRKSLRKEIFPEYKKTRHTNITPEERENLERAYRQFRVLHKRILPEIGFSNIFMEDGFEGDDLIASIINNDMYQQDFLIYANDHDLYQLLSPRVSMIANKKVYTIGKFVEEFGINPSQWWMVKAIAGCSSDEVPGIKGVGEKTACKYLRKEMNEKTSTFAKIVDQLPIVQKKNEPLVKLPFEGTPKIDLRPDNFNLRKTMKLFKYFELESLVEEFCEWREVLK